MSEISEMSELTWDEVFGRKDLVGGDIEIHESGTVVRGPLAEIKEEAGMIYFLSPWRGMFNRVKGFWENGPNAPISVNKEWSTPKDIGQGRISFGIPFLGNAVIFPVGGSKLDKDLVKGLPALA